MWGGKLLLMGAAIAEAAEDSPIITIIPSEAPSAEIEPTVTVPPIYTLSPSPEPTPMPSPTPVVTATPVPTPEPSFWEQMITIDPTVPIYEQPVFYVAIGCVILLVLLALLIVKLCRRGRRNVRVTTREIAPAQSGGIRVGNAQHIGTRESQQDSFGMSNLNDAQLMEEKGFLAVVADGMGGLSNGAQISGTVVDSMLKGFINQKGAIEPAMRLLMLVQDAQKKVLEMPMGASGGSTVVAVLINGDKLYMISVGDSRIYLLRNGGLMQLTREHVYASDLDERASRREMSYSIALHDAQRKALTSYIGMPELEKIDRNLHPVTLVAGDKVLLVTDGVFGSMSDAELTSLMIGDAFGDAIGISNAVVAKQLPTQDNLTVVVIEYLG